MISWARKISRQVREAQLWRGGMAAKYPAVASSFPPMSRRERTRLWWSFASEDVRRRLALWIYPGDAWIEEIPGDDYARRGRT